MHKIISMLIGGVFFFVLASFSFAENETRQDQRIFVEHLVMAPQMIPAEVESVSSEQGQIDNICINDSLEPLNRAMFMLNDKVYFWFAKPVAKAYGTLVPEQGRIGIRNAFNNIATPVRFVSNLLQLKIRGAGIEFSRFVLNSTVGIGGLIDVATKDGLETPKEDVGQALGSYGIGNGPYIVWPFLGPSSLRDTAGTVGDFFLNPLSYINPEGVMFGARSTDYTNDTSLHIGDYEDFKEAAIDPYVSMKDAYCKYRKNKIKE